ncbi:hypothetical protein WAI453_000758 [Rhynchosporium graminicola]
MISPVEGKTCRSQLYSHSYHYLKDLLIGNHQGTGLYRFLSQNSLQRGIILELGMIQKAKNGPRTYWVSLRVQLGVFTLSVRLGWHEKALPLVPLENRPLVILYLEDYAM